MSCHAPIPSREAVVLALYRAGLLPLEHLVLGWILAHAEITSASARWSGPTSWIDVGYSPKTLRRALDLLAERGLLTRTKADGGIVVEVDLVRVVGATHAGDSTADGGNSSRMGGEFLPHGAGISPASRARASCAQGSLQKSTTYSNRSLSCAHEAETGSAPTPAEGQGEIGASPAPDASALAARLAGLMGKPTLPRREAGVLLRLVRTYGVEAVEACFGECEHAGSPVAYLAKVVESRFEPGGQPKAKPSKPARGRSKARTYNRDPEVARQRREDFLARGGRW